MLTTLVIAGVATSMAQALPGDPGFEPLTPPDGATLSVSPAGAPVTYTCPVYRQFTAGTGFTIFGGPDDYTAGFSRSNALGNDGRLRDDGLVALDEGHESNTLPSGQCTSTFAAGGSERPQETPGTTMKWRSARCEAAMRSGRCASSSCARRASRR